MALLAVIAALRPDLPAPVACVHVNHQLQPEASAWESFVARKCRGWHVPLHRLVVEIDGTGQEDPEGRARRERYRAFSRLVGPGDLLLLAHHQDDQAETVLLRLFRGAGVRGLSGMPELRRLGEGWLGRPCLRLPRRLLREYGVRAGAGGCRDPSNEDEAHRRNFIRHRVLPALTPWPAAPVVLARIADLQREASGLLDELAKRDLETVRGGGDGSLSVVRLSRFEEARARNAIRFWLRLRGVPLPGCQETIRLVAAIRGHEPGSAKEIRWRGGVARFHRDRVYAARPEPVSPVVASMVWVPPSPVPCGGGVLRAARGVGRGLSIVRSKDIPFSVRARRGGERMRVAGRGMTKSVKALLREADIPRWDRFHIPLVYAGDRLAAIPGVAYCEALAATRLEPGWVLSWTSGGSP